MPLAFNSPIRLQTFSWWVALALFAGLGGIIVLMGMRSLGGLGPARKWVAISVRLLVLAVLILILGRALWEQRHRDMEVMILHDVSDSMNNLADWPGRDAPTEKERRTRLDATDSYFRSLSTDPTKRPDDRIGLIRFDKFARVDAMPNKELRLDTRSIVKPEGGTDIGTAIQLALATMSPDAMHRLILYSDGGNNVGDVEPAINAAVAQHVPIDVVPVKYDIQNDISVDRFVAPAWKREGEAFNLTVVLRNTNPINVKGKLTVVEKYPDRTINLDVAPGTDKPKERAVTLKPGPNVEIVRVPPVYESGVHRFEAVFEPEGAGAGGVSTSIATPGGAAGGGAGGGGADAAAKSKVDAVDDNNSAQAFTFVKGKQQILYVDNTVLPGQQRPGEMGDYLVQQMLGMKDDPRRPGEGIVLKSISIDQFPKDVVELQNYDAVILNNVPKGSVLDSEGGTHLSGLSNEQDIMLRTYVHDLGGGLLVIGGDQAFGAGGWQGSELEKVLPVDMEIPAQRQIGKGALVMIMHACEMPQGNYWGEQCALKAVETLSSRDEVGVISYDWGGNGNHKNGVGGANGITRWATSGARKRSTRPLRRWPPAICPASTIR